MNNAHNIPTARQILMSSVCYIYTIYPTSLHHLGSGLGSL